MININEYQRMAARTMNDKADNVVNGALGLCGEAGEVADIIKKCRFQGHDFEENRGKVLEEIGDCAWYMACICTAMGEKLSDVLQRNIDKLIARYPNGFSAERSVNRQE